MQIKEIQTFLVFDSLMYKRGGGDVLNEVKLAKKAIKGNEEAFLEIMLLYKKDLFRTALAYLKNEEQALEALQEVTYRVFRKIHTVQKPQYLKTWTIRIMMNYCQDTLEKNKREIFNDVIIEQQGIEDSFTYLEIDEAMQLLTKEERELIHLRYLHEIKIKEIAAMTNTPEGTIKTRLYKALRTMRNYFDEKGEMHRVQ